MSQGAGKGRAIIATVNNQVSTLASIFSYDVGGTMGIRMITELHHVQGVGITLRPPPLLQVFTPLHFPSVPLPSSFTSVNVPSLCSSTSLDFHFLPLFSCSSRLFTSLQDPTFPESGRTINFYILHRPLCDVLH